MTVILLALGLLPAAAQGTPAGIAIQKDVDVSGKRCDTVTWTDANGRARSVAFVRAGGDVGAYSGGYIQRYTYYVDAVQRTALADESMPGVSGLGCAVSHHSGASISKSHSTGATTGFLLEGANHAIWRFKSTMSGDGSSVGLVIDWFISNGRNDVLWAVSYDSTGQATFNWDARGPYFQFDWDGDGQFFGAAISGIRWGDKYRFRTTSTPGTGSSWDYTQLSPAPYMMLYKDASLNNTEAGVVQTQTWAQQDAGGYWWASAHWGQTGTGMMENWNCPFQLNAYEGYTGEKMAWGSPFGFVGNPSYQRIDWTNAVGAPHQGYSTWIILNKHTEGLTDAMINGVGAVQATTLSATTGTVVASGPRHAGLAGDAPYQPAGWNHVYGSWAIQSGASNAAAFSLAVGSGTLVRPLFEIRGYSAATPPANISLGGTALAAGTDYSASVDTAAQKLWITLNRNLAAGTHAFSVGGAAPAPAPSPSPSPSPAPAPAPAPAGGGSGGDKDEKCSCGSAMPGAWWPLAAAALLAYLRRPA